MLGDMGFNLILECRLPIGFVVASGKTHGAHCPLGKTRHSF